MAISDFQSIMLPLLKFAASRDEVSTGEAYNAMVEHFHLSAADQNQPMPSGPWEDVPQPRRLGEAVLGVRDARRVVRRGDHRATDMGRRWAKERTAGLKLADFKAIPGYDEHVHGQAVKPQGPEDASVSATPDERIETADAEIRQRTIATLLERIVQKPPAFFERLAIDLS